VHIHPIALARLCYAKSNSLFYRDTDAEVLCNERGIYFFPKNEVAQHNLIYIFVEWVTRNPGKPLHLYRGFHFDPDRKDYREVTYESLVELIYAINRGTGNSHEVQRRLRHSRVVLMQNEYEKLVNAYSERDNGGRLQHSTEALNAVALRSGVKPGHVLKYLQTGDRVRGIRAELKQKDKLRKMGVDPEDPKGLEHAMANADPTKYVPNEDDKAHAQYLTTAVQRARVAAYNKGVPSDFKMPDLLRNAGITNVNNAATYPKHCPVLHIPLQYSKDKTNAANGTTTTNSTTRKHEPLKLTPVHNGYPLNAARVWRTSKSEPGAGVGAGLTPENVNIVSHAAYVILDGGNVSADKKKEIKAYIRKHRQDR
jgi:hypothetical protein